jgi:hypothetical protein
MLIPPVEVQASSSSSAHYQKRFLFVGNGRGLEKHGTPILH